LTRFRQLSVCCAIIAGAAAATASSASGATFYVNQRGGNPACSGQGSLACEKVSETVAQAEKVAGPNTIEIESNEGEEGLYKESLALEAPKTPA
jgi:hypothetical protein